MTAKRYRARPEIIEAMQVTADNLDEVAEWCGGRAGRRSEAILASEFDQLADEMSEWAQVSFDVADEVWIGNFDESFEAVE